MNLRKAVPVIIFIVSLVLIVCVCVNALVPDPATVAQSRVQIGDERKKAVEALSDAWFHTECEHPIAADLFFYGSRNRDRVKIVVVESEVADEGKQLVSFVGTTENYMLHLYEDCVPPPSTAFGDTTSRQ
jgi:hypothetical protein